MQKMSDSLDITYQQLQKYESGQSRMKIDMVIDMAVFFDIEPLDMFSILLGRGDGINHAKTLLSEDALELISLYDSIKNEKVRKQLTTLLKGITDN